MEGERELASICWDEVTKQTYQQPELTASLTGSPHIGAMSYGTFECMQTNEICSKTSKERIIGRPSLPNKFNHAARLSQILYQQKHF